MTPRLLLSLGCLLLACRLPAASEEPPPPQKSRVREALRARAAEDAKKIPAKQTPSPAKAPAPASPEASSPAATTTPRESSERAASTPVTVMPKVEVRKDRITVLDQQLALQEEAIARERKNTKVTETDLALNDAKIAQPLAIFGGESAQFRQRVASERVALMEAEKDLMEAIARAKTKAEKEELQKQLDQLRAMRRDLDKALR